MTLVKVYVKNTVGGKMGVPVKTIKEVIAKLQKWPEESVVSINRNWELYVLLPDGCEKVIINKEGSLN